MDTILSFGAGVQTTALAILIAERKLEVDAVVFADTGAEKPETYSYMEDYTKPLLNSVSVPFITVKASLPSDRGGIYEFYSYHQDIPSIQYRQCTNQFKRRPIERALRRKYIPLIGFNADETNRAANFIIKNKTARFPLIELGMHSKDSQTVISNYGWPIPLKSSCFFCIYQPVLEWNWLKNHHPDLFQKALDLEANYHKRKPEFRDNFGLLRGTPLWRLQEGLQPEMFQTGELSCWSGYCSH